MYYDDDVVIPNLITRSCLAVSHSLNPVHRSGSKLDKFPIENGLFLPVHLILFETYVTLSCIPMFRRYPRKSLSFAGYELTVVFIHSALVAHLTSSASLPVMQTRCAFNGDNLGTPAIISEGLWLM